MSHPSPPHPLVLCLQVFLIKHYKNRRTDDWDFVLDFEEVYVIDTKTKTISRAPVEVGRPSCTTNN